MNTKIKIAIAEDHHIFREAFIKSLKNVEDIEVVFGASNGAELIQGLKRNPVDVVLLDLEMPVMDGRATLAEIRRSFPSIRVLILSFYYSDPHVRKFIQLGARGYLSKDFGYETALDAIRDVFFQGYFFYDKVSRELLVELITDDSLTLDSPRNSLSKREEEIIKLICQEKTNVEMAEILSISVRTVQNHRLHIAKKIGARNAVGMLIYALKNGLFKIEP